jgi:hypothetical protein
MNERIATHEEHIIPQTIKYYVRRSESAPWFLFSEEANGTALNASDENLTLLRGDTYIFELTENSDDHPFNVGDAFQSNETGINVTSTGTSDVSVNGVASLIKTGESLTFTLPMENCDYDLIVSSELFTNAPGHAPTAIFAGEYLKETQSGLDDYWNNTASTDTAKAGFGTKPDALWTRYYNWVDPSRPADATYSQLSHNWWHVGYSSKYSSYMVGNSESSVLMAPDLGAYWNNVGFYSPEGGATEHDCPWDVDWSWEGLFDFATPPITRGSPSSSAYGASGIQSDHWTSREMVYGCQQHSAEQGVLDIQDREPTPSPTPTLPPPPPPHIDGDPHVTTFFGEKYDM